ncbi:MAG: hypothetical protein FD123_2453 [Bacteroidetes bacterium]|nr:MAG: hypothetical protein FD123_2453 [Bacteroidota bacterium]
MCLPGENRINHIYCQEANIGQTDLIFKPIRAKKCLFVSLNRCFIEIIAPVVGLSEVYGLIYTNRF